MVTEPVRSADRLEAYAAGQGLIPTGRPYPASRGLTGRVRYMMDADNQHRPDPSGYDAELRRHNEALRRACNIQFGDHVLDIGCGTRQTTRQAVEGGPPMSWPAD